MAPETKGQGLIQEMAFGKEVGKSPTPSKGLGAGVMPLKCEQEGTALEGLGGLQAAHEARETMVHWNLRMKG